MTRRSAIGALPATVLLMLLALTGCASSVSPVGDWGQVGPGQASLSISSDGSFSGTDGCNAVEGKGSISGDTFTFAPPEPGANACFGVTPWLNLAHSAKVDGGKLVVYRTGGQQLGTLDRR
ncbi:MAG: META domain-containing protein [Leifsonia sp.]